MKKLRIVPVFMLAGMLLGLGCPPPKGGGRPGGGGAAGIDPDACGDISTSKVGRKLYSFLVASAELDRASVELESSVKKACQRMARELGISDAGDTRTVCSAAARELEANLEVSVKTEKQLVTRYTPAECTTEVDFAAGIVAECEATVAADVEVTCEGSCGGTCTGACDGTCATTGPGGECAGVCEGTCRGRCSADCQGYVDVDASAECKASAEIRASVNTTCTEPKVEVVEEDVTIIDATKFDRAMKAIAAGMPALLRAAAKAELVMKGIGNWATTLGGLVKASGDLVAQIGDKGLCVGVQLAASLAAAAQIQARVSVSIEVSAEISASAGAQAQ